MDKFFSLFLGPVRYPVLCVVSAVCIGAGYVSASVPMFVGGMGLMALAVMTFVWEDSKQYPEVG